MDKKTLKRSIIERFVWIVIFSQVEMLLEKLIKRQDFIDVFTQKLKLKQLTEVQV
jgi:hypothetical protein